MSFIQEPSSLPSRARSPTCMTSLDCRGHGLRPLPHHLAMLAFEDLTAPPASSLTPPPHKPTRSNQVPLKVLIPAGHKSQSPAQSSQIVSAALPFRHVIKESRMLHQQTDPSTDVSRHNVGASSGGAPQPRQRRGKHNGIDPMPAVLSDPNSSHPRAQTIMQDAPEPVADLHAIRQGESIKLQHLAHVVRLAERQERKRAHMRSRLQKYLVSAALDARLSQCSDAVHWSLAKSFLWKDDATGFASLYSALQDIRESCNELKRYATLDPDPDVDILSSRAVGSPNLSDTPDSSVTAFDTIRYAPSFLQEIPASARKTFMDFLTELRNNPDYLASRICALSGPELNSLLGHHKESEALSSVLPLRARFASGHRTEASTRNNIDSEIERLQSFHRHDPLSILIHCCFATSAGMDSSEVQKRIDIWATALARLIQQSRPTSELRLMSEQFLISVLNIWIAMCGWSGKLNMERYIMNLLNDGAFILARAEDRDGTRFNLSDWTSADDVAAKDFYEQAVLSLFEMVDDEGATAIPDGLLELGSAILQKLDGGLVASMSRWLVWRCLFVDFLLRSLVQPELYGMLSDYHITSYARAKILEKVAMKARQNVFSIFREGPPSDTIAPTVVTPRIKDHVESIVARFQPSQSRHGLAARLPTWVEGFSEETATTRKYLVLSPSDLATLVNALYPEAQQRTSSTFNENCHGSRPPSRPAFSRQSSTMTGIHKMDTETTSIIVNASDPSEAIYQEKIASFISQEKDKIHCSSTDTSASGDRLSGCDDDVHRLKLAVHEMNQTLGSDAVQGRDHPCAERWAVLFLCSDGTTLTTTMPRDTDDEKSESQSSSSADTSERDVLDSETDESRRIRDAILTLVEKYKFLPRSGISDDSKYLTKRAPIHALYTPKTSVFTPETHTSSCDHDRKHPIDKEAYEACDPERPLLNADDQPILIETLESACLQARSQADFVSFRIYWEALQRLNARWSLPLRRKGIAMLVDNLSLAPQNSSRRSAAAIEDYEAWLLHLKEKQAHHQDLLSCTMRRVRALRDKMWFATQIYSTELYEHCRNVCQGLKTMGIPRRWQSLHQVRANASRTSGLFLNVKEIEVMDRLAASEEQGGPNKLSDDQAEMTATWLRESSIQNFCEGEERVHRFCYEVDKCVANFIGDSTSKAPLLWFSSLYLHESRMFERMRAVMEKYRGFDAPSNGTAYVPRREGVPETTATSTGTFRPTLRWADPLGSAISWEDALIINLATWSIAHSTQSAKMPLALNSSILTGQPGRSSAWSSQDAEQHIEKVMVQFLTELRQTLTSLLVSDIGGQFLSQGSDTDSWFQSFGQQFIEKRMTTDRLVRGNHERQGKVNANSYRDSAQTQIIGRKRSAMEISQQQLSKPLGAGSNRDMESPGSISFETQGTNRQEETSQIFSFEKAYGRLLDTFSSHPNPLAKLDALDKIEKLIQTSYEWNKSTDLSVTADTTSETTRGRRSSAPKATVDVTMGDLSDGLPQAMDCTLPTRGESSCRSHPRTQSNRSAGSTSKSHIVSEFQRLFRDVSLRPRLLFRNLQLISALVPSSVLDHSERGKAFWSAGLAAWQLKTEACRTMIEIANEVVKGQDTSHCRERSSIQESFVNIDPCSTSAASSMAAVYSWEDVGKMLTIAAKEGHAAAQRELALFYLAKPESVGRVTLPLSRAQDVFKTSVMERYQRSDKVRGSSTNFTNASKKSRVKGTESTGSTRNSMTKARESDVRNDVGLMCVAVHWMEVAARNGDKVAMTFLQQNDFGGLS